jgi:DnaJ-class molecular chaperone
VQAGAKNAGDQYVEVTVDIPKNLPPQAKEQFESLKAMLAAKAG